MTRTPATFRLQPDTLTKLSKLAEKWETSQSKVLDLLVRERYAGEFSGTLEKEVAELRARVEALEGRRE